MWRRLDPFGGGGELGMMGATPPPCPPLPPLQPAVGLRGRRRLLVGDGGVAALVSILYAVSALWRTQSEMGAGLKGGEL